MYVESLYTTSLTTSLTSPTLSMPLIPLDSLPLPSCHISISSCLYLYKNKESQTRENVIFFYPRVAYVPISSCIHFPAHDLTSLVFIGETNVIVYTYHILFIYYSFDGQHRFHNLAIASGAMDMKPICDVLSRSPLSKIPRSGTDGSYGTSTKIGNFD